MNQYEYEHKMKFAGRNCENCVKPTQANRTLDGSYLCSPCYRACTG